MRFSTRAFFGVRLLQVTLATWKHVINTTNLPLKMRHQLFSFKGLSKSSCQVSDCYCLDSLCLFHKRYFMYPNNHRSDILGKNNRAVEVLPGF